MSADEINIGISQNELDALPAGQPPALDEALLHGRTPPPEDICVIITPTALQQIDTHANSNLYSELGGILLGHAYHHNDQIHVEISAAVPAPSDEHGPVHFTFTADAWRHVHQTRNETYPQLNIIGWFHTHPNLGVFYSSDDVVVQSVAFDMPWHVGLVVDPVRRECSFFGWHGRQINPLAGFYEQTQPEQHPTSAIDWRVQHRSGLGNLLASAYDSYTYANENPANDQEMYYAAREVTLFPPRTNFIMAGIALLFAALILFGGIMPLHHRTRNLEQLTAAFAVQQMAEQEANGLASCPNNNLQLMAPLAGSEFIAGQEITLFGTADHPQAYQYQLQYRRYDNPKWQFIDSFRWPRTIEELSVWQTNDLPSGIYKVRLMALKNSGIPIAGQACTIAITITSPPPPTAEDATPAPAPLPTPIPGSVPEPPSNPASGGTTSIDE